VFTLAGAVDFTAALTFCLARTLTAPVAENEPYFSKSSQADGPDGSRGLFHRLSAGRL